MVKQFQTRDVLEQENLGNLNCHMMKTLENGYPQKIKMLVKVLKI